MPPVDSAGRLLVSLRAAAVIAQNNTMPDGLQEAVGWVNNPSQRGTLMLIIECLTTIFTCTWTVLHLNVPAPTDSTWTRFLRKVKWMFITILFPEFILAKAICEFCLALHTFDLMATMMKSHPAWFKSRSIYTSTMSHSVIVTRIWKADYRPWMQLLQRWVILTLWPPKIVGNQPAGNENGSPPARGSRASSLTRVGDSELKNTPEDTGIPMSEQNGRPPARRSRTSSLTRVGISELEGTSEDTGIPVSEQNGTPKFQEHQDWTIIHAYYANMGGLRARRSTTDGDNDTSEYSVLRGDHLAHWNLGEWRRGHPLQELRLSAADIADKSKADWLVRLLSMFQISRLVLDLINRAAIHRPVTQLELGTAAFAVFALVTYLVNWWKPKDISQPTLLHYVVDERRSDEAIQRSAEPFFSRLLSPIPRTLYHSEFVSQHYRIKNDELWMDGDFPVVWPLMAVLCVVFGAFHCIAWRWQFPTNIERHLWQSASVVSTLSPLIPLAFSNFLIRHSTRRLARHQIEAIEEIQTKLLPLLSLSEDCVQLLHSNIQDPNWRLVFGDGHYENPQRKIIEYMTSLLELRILLLNLKKEDEKNRQANLLENIWTHMLQLKATRESMDEEPWIRYRKHVILLARELGIPSLETNGPLIFETLHICSVEVSLDQWSHRSQYQRSKKRLESGIRRYARYVNIFFGIIYAISRVVLVALMFSSLRAVPKDVYEVAGWTRFLPSFS